MTRNNHYKKNFIKAENKNRIIKFKTIFFLNNFPFKYTLYNKLNKLKSKKINKSKTLIKNFCLLTGRSKSINKRYLISRIKMRELILFGLIPGCKKSVW
jgi:ribosomal protein S14